MLRITVANVTSNNRAVLRNIIVSDTIPEIGQMYMYSSIDIFPHVTPHVMVGRLYGDLDKHKIPDKDIRQKLIAIL